MQEIADLFAEGNFPEAHVKAEDMGWERLGRGIARVAYKVSTDDQDGPAEEPAHEAPCVIKFGTQGRGNASGETQNAEEVHQFQAFPEGLSEGKNGDVPAVVPMKDWDGDDYRWVSAPLVNPIGGDPHEAAGRLAKHGWECADLHSGNVGEMHGKAVVMDYGLECGETGPNGMALADEMVDELDRLGVDNITATDEGNWTDIQFTPPAGLLSVGVPHEQSLVRVRLGGVSYMEIVVGQYEGDELDYTPPLDTAAERVVRTLENNRWMASVFHRPREKNGDMMVGFEIENTAGDNWPPEIAAEIIDDVHAAVEAEFPGGREHPISRSEEPISPEEGMVLDHPDFDNPIEIVDVDDDGNVMATDEDGMEYNLRLADYADITDGMVISDDQQSAVGPDDVALGDVYHHPDYGDVEVRGDPIQVDDFESQPWMVEVKPSDKDFTDSVRVDRLSSVVDEPLASSSTTTPTGSPSKEMVQLEIEEAVDRAVEDEQTSQDIIEEIEQEFEQAFD